MSVVALEQPTTRYGLWQVIRSEMIKMWSLRSTYWTVLITLVGSFTVTVLSVWPDRHYGASNDAGFDPTNASLSGMAIAVLALGVLSALSATSEYGSGTIRATLSAAPRRPLALAAKVLVVGGTALVIGEVITFGCWEIGQIVLRSGGAPTASLAHPAVVRAVVLSGVFLSLLGLVGLALGVIFRHTAGAISAYVAVTFVIPLLLSTLHSRPDRYTPVPMLANSISAVIPSPQALPVTKAMILMVVYTVASLGVAAVMIVRRDA
jgi:ABC-2 type transport system permease protein